MTTSPELGATPPPHTSPPPRPPTAGSPPPSFGPRPTPAKGFFAGLFDFGFTTFVTPKVIKFFYVVIFILICIGWIFWLIAGFRSSSGAGTLVLIFGPLVSLLWLILYRITLELVMVIFRLGADVHAVRDRTDQ
ncbi:DUF4282 domain-containing protein [Streptomyces chryseus]